MYRLWLAAGRTVLRARGPDAMPLLHSLATNDMYHLQGSSDCLYTMFLNPRGRILFDSIVYSAAEPDTLLIDCDKTLSTSLLKHLNMYKLKKDVKIELSDHDIWLLFDPSLNHDTSHSTESVRKFPNAFIDPRLNLLGFRMLFRKSTTVADILKQLDLPNVNLLQNGQVYRNFRYKLGILEGNEDIPIGNSFPLEANCDYMHGVSFHKGCYIGQELTARTHHTGVVRKRIMPILFEREITTEIPNDTLIYGSTSDKAIGKIRGVSKDAGIGLLRVTEALSSPSLKILDYSATTFRPKWWPTEASKEKIN